MQVRKLLVFISFYSCVQAYWLEETTFKLGVGPGWFQMLTDERFTATSDGAPGSMQTVTENNLGPWIDGAVRMQFCDYIIAEAYAGGGWVRKGYGKQINKILGVDTTTVSKYFPLDANLSGDIALVYLGVGPRYKISDRYALSVTAGYAYNGEKWIYSMFARPERVCEKDTWQAGYIGVDSSLQLCDFLTVNFYYKALIGNAKSNLVQTNIITREGYPDRRVVPLFFGNILQLTGKYEISPCWFTGLTVMYTYLQNMRNGCVSPANVNIRNNYFEHMRFNMLTITGSIEYIY